MDQETSDYYDSHAGEFAARTASLEMGSLQQRFLSRLPAGARILDAGCGSGRDARAFLDAGYKVCAADGSRGMCTQAESLGVRACCLQFGEVCGPDLYDGIWACASLLHVPKAELPEVLRRFHWALRPGGILYMSVKRGSGEERRLGRFFADYTLEEARQAVEEGGLFSVLEAFETTDVRPEYASKPWINLLAQSLPPPPAGFARSDVCINK